MFLLDWIFYHSSLPAETLDYHWNGYLVALSYLVAVLASFVVIEIAIQLRKSEKKSLSLCFFGALAVGSGIFSMHFIGMLAYVMPINISYDITLTLISLLFASVGAGCSLWMIRNKIISTFRLLIAVAIFAIAVISMHYIGMAAMVGVEIHYFPILFISSIIVAFIVSFVAFVLIFYCDKLSGGKQFLVKIGSASIMGLAISGMHYAAMLSAVITPLESERALIENISIRSEILSLIVTILAAVILILAVVTISYRQRIIFKLLTGYIVLAILGLSIGSMVIKHIHSSTKEIEATGWKKNKIEYLQTFAYLLEHIKIAMQPLLTATTIDKKVLLSKVKEYGREVDDQGKQLTNLILTTPQLQTQLLFNLESMLYELAITADYIENNFEDKMLLHQINQVLVVVERSLNFIDLSVEEETQELERIVARFVANTKDIVLILLILMIASVLVSVFIILFLEHQFSNPIRKLKEGAASIAQGDFSYRVDVRNEDELGLLAEEFNNMVTALDTLNKQIILFTELGEALSVSSTEDEIKEIVRTFATQLIPGRGGMIAQSQDTENNLVQMITWGEEEQKFPKRFPWNECWALRKGQPFSNYSIHGLRCKHVDPALGGYLCIPLASSGKVFGVCTVVAGEKFFTDHENKLITKFVFDVGTALINISLRGHFQQLSMLDSLTSLYNRRYMEEILEREVHRAERNQLPLSLIMLDLDHFKEVNDTYGHILGDLVLQGVSSYLKNNFRKVDIICRYGGEEFVVILPETGIEQALQLAETLRAGAQTIVTRVGHELFNLVNLSLGVAAYPVDGKKGSELIAAADRALYYAKEGGRNKVCRASTQEIK